MFNHKQKQIDRALKVLVKDENKLRTKLEMMRKKKEVLIKESTDLKTKILQVIELMHSRGTSGNKAEVEIKVVT